MRWDQTVQKWVYKSKRSLGKNAPTILTVIGAAGVIATGVTAAKATPKALKALEACEAEKGYSLTTMEKVEVAGPHYIPSVLIGVGSIACIFGANVLNKRQQAALVSAYTLVDTSYKEYKKKVEELYGEGTNANVRREISKDHYEESNIDREDDTPLYYDAFSGRYFNARKEDILNAMYQLNRQLRVNTGVYLNDWYEYLDNDDVRPKPEFNEFGWSSGILESHYWAEWIDFDEVKVDTDDGLEYTIISFRYEPVIDFAYY